VNTMATFIAVATDTVVVEDQLSFSLQALCQASGTPRDLVQALVEEGLLQPAGQGPHDWCFGGDALPMARRAQRLERDFNLGAPALGLVLDLLAEIQRLRASVRQP